MAKYLIDFDGVILDTQDRFDEYMSAHKEIQWYDYLTSLDWDGLINESKEINDSLRIIREAEKKGIVLGILTKVYSLQEASSKIRFLRENGITSPVMIAPYTNSKADIWFPKPDEVLIDDKIENVEDFISRGGQGILFDEKGRKKYKNKVKSLEFLLSEN